MVWMSGFGPLLNAVLILLSVARPGARRHSRQRHVGVPGDRQQLSGARRRIHVQDLDGVAALAADLRRAPEFLGGRARVPGAGVRTHDEHVVGGPRHLRRACRALHRLDLAEPVPHIAERRARDQQDDHHHQHRPPDHPLARAARAPAAAALGGPDRGWRCGARRCTGGSGRVLPPVPAEASAASAPPARGRRRRCASGASGAPRPGPDPRARRGARALGGPRRGRPARPRRGGPAVRGRSACRGPRPIHREDGGP